MSREADKKISDTLQRFGIPFAGNVWRVQGTPVMYHRTLEEIAAQTGIVFQTPTLVRAERDECVMLVHGSIPVRDEDGKPTGQTRHEWSLGEAVINVNYRVSGKQAAYVYAMAEKRAKDRVILKLIELSGHVYSETESDDFKSGSGPERSMRAANAQGDNDGPTNPAEIDADLRRRIDEAATINAVTDLMLSERTQDELASLAPGIRDDVRAYATNRLKALGWKPTANKGRRAA